MAQLEFLSFSPCAIYGALLDRNVVASGKYHDATSELMYLAGQREYARFAEAKRNCEIRLDECKRTTDAMRTHRATHGC